MEIRSVPGGVLLRGAANFSPEQTFTCGQCFRWNRKPDGSWEGVAHGRALTIYQKDQDSFLLSGTDAAEFDTLWREYFDFSFDYGAAIDSFAHDRHLSKAAGAGNGIRILKQDLWETTASFILSANNNITRIKGIVERLCAAFGKPLPGGHFAFPAPLELSGITADGLAPLRAGYRASYLADAVRQFPLLDQKTIRSAPLDEARAELQKIKGVGPKVADCILLFGAGRTEAFPIDVWVARVMGALYGPFQNRAAVSAFAAEHFGANAGLAQQYLFYYGRENKIKVG